MAQQTLTMEHDGQMATVFGNFDSHLQLIEQACGVRILSREGQLRISGEGAGPERALSVLKSLFELSEKGEPITPQVVRYCINLSSEGLEGEVVKLSEDCVCITARGKPVKAKTMGQRSYIRAIADNTVTFAVGPAGTGKTYLAVAMAVAAFARKEVSRIILTRPAVEAGEKLGFLPGDLQHKVDPYLRPLYDALFDMLGAETHQKYLERGTIEVAPLAYMRGRTLDDSFIILDEAQNTTPEQMKMFLTRLGFQSKVVITGDVTQIDLPTGKQSGLREAVKIFSKVEDIAICQLTARDVVRHKLVQDIIKAYESYEQRKARQSLKKTGVKSRDGTQR